MSVTAFDDEEVTAPTEIPVSPTRIDRLESRLERLCEALEANTRAQEAYTNAQLQLISELRRLVVKFDNHYERYIQPMGKKS